MTYSKLLHQLSIKQLRQELQDRGLKTVGSRETLTARLRQALNEEEEDPETYQFEVEPGINDVIGKIQECGDAFKEQMNTIRNMMGNMSRNIMLTKVDETEVEGQTDQSDQMVSQAKGEINSLVKERMPGQDCGCTNSGDGGAGDWRAVCDCVVGKSDGSDFESEKHDNDCCDDLNGINRIERKEANKETREVCYVPETFVTGVRATSLTDQDNVGSESKLAAVDLKDLCLSVSTFDENSNHESLKTVSDSLPLMSSGEIANTGSNNGRDRNNEFGFAWGIRENLMPGKCRQAIDMNCICGALRGQCPCQETQLQDLNLADICTSAYISERGLNDGELIPAEPDAVVDEHLLMEQYNGASWTYRTDEAEKDYVFEIMATCGPTTVLQDVHGKCPLTQRPGTTALETTVIVTTSNCVKWLANLTSTNSPCVSWLASATVFKRSKQRPRHRLKRRLANWKKRKRRQRKTVQMASWATGTLPSVSPTDRPPPELSNFNCTVSFRDEKH